MSHPRNRQSTPQRTPRRHLLPVLAAVFAVGLAGSARAAEPIDSLAAAHRAFAQGRYREAAADFESVIRERGFSPALLYDLANSYQRQGSTGRAILNYRRAQLLAPRDRDVAANLATARAASGLPAPALPAYRAVAQLLSATTWTWLAAGGLWLAAAALGVAALQRRWRRLLHPLAAAALLGGASAVAAAALLGPVDAHGVIVAQKSAPLRLAPFDAAEVQWSLPEGEEVALGQRHGDFVQARDGEGHAGWLKSILVEPLIPRSR